MGLAQVEENGVIGGFKFDKILGRGGMGVVYKAHELSLNRKVALKILSERLSADEEFITRFKREAKVVAALNHPNIVRILSYGEEQGLHYFAMEYVQGRDLGQILKEKKSLPLAEALAIGIQVADALQEASEKGVVHRDLKPANIMIDSLGRVKVTDYGIAYFQDSEVKLTQTGLYMGTPEFSSPEQAAGKKLDIRSDIYSLGGMLYKMLSGESPVQGESPLAVVAKIMTEPVRPLAEVNPAVPALICQLIDKMMAKDLQKRFQSPGEVMDAIHFCVNKLHIEMPSATRMPVSRNPAPVQLDTRNYVKMFGATAGIIVAILLSMWSVDALFDHGKQGKDVEVADVVTPDASQSKEISPAATLPATTSEDDKTEVITAAPQQETEEPGGLEEESKIAHVAPDDGAAAEKMSAPSPFLPKIPVILTAVTGDESLVHLVRAHLESVLMRSGLSVASVTEFPVLMEKMQVGASTISWYDIKRLLPPESANILLVADIQKTGTMPLEYYGRQQTLTNVSLTLRAMDAQSGATAASARSASAKFTPLNMDENLRKAVSATTGTMAAEIQRYWRKKLQDAHHVDKS